ncbi:ligase-associated DNA damage response endonuclease PdeM [Ulvibacterium marinum]|uniref:Ligase-associated DNA damage response endonuclease PdeM n=1 Tax=Ulvibacterium marinum TaxID=2419782 RepID=A0A3B0CCU2_9FLAO|nr:ligase-associated DNA damage response endonuclease PdeM [Ulvibacterium marinum]RKN82348.1 ligase-associated DNA damage response endonuclease PdeM [Ulvibacterium marinum]
MNGHQIQIQDQNFTLHPSGTLFWQDRSVLLISDAHLGKVSHFRKFGAAVPQNVVQKNFELMDEALDCFNPKTICFLGDLFHSALNKEWHLFENWVEKKTIKIILVAGNHDIISPLKYEGLGIEVVPEVQWDDFLLTHHPEERNGFFNFSGHIHPAIRLRGRGRQSLRLPCFFKSERQMILPAFGLFTGTFVLEPKKTDEVFAIVEDEIMKL